MISTWAHFKVMWWHSSDRRVRLIPLQNWATEGRWQLDSLASSTADWMLCKCIWTVGVDFYPPEGHLTTTIYIYDHSTQFSKKLGGKDSADASPSRGCICDGSISIVLDLIVRCEQSR